MADTEERTAPSEQAATQEPVQEASAERSVSPLPPKRSNGAASPPRNRRIIENPDRRRNFERSTSPEPRRRSASRSPSPRFSRNRDWRPRIIDSNQERYHERVRQALERELDTEPKKEEPKKPLSLSEEYARLKELRDAGRFVPTAKLRALEAQLNVVKSPEEQQRASWEILKKSINSLINKVNHQNIKDIAQEIFTLNLIRGRGEFCRSIMNAQSMAQPFTPVYAALVAVVNSKLPQVGELLLTRLVIRFRRSFKQNKKDACLSTAIFIAHLCNHQLAHEIIALEILFLLLGNPTNDSVEIAVAFTKEVGAYLAEVSKAGSNGVFERFRAILHEGSLEKRTQYMIEVLFQVRKDEFKDNEIIPTGLDLVEEEEQITHMIGLDDKLDGQEGLRLFKFDENFEENEEKYAEMRREILGEDSDEEDGDDSDAEDSVSEAEDEPSTAAASNEPMAIKDMTNVELVSLRKTIYLTIMSSMSVDEAAHKLLRVQVPEGKEIEIVNMIVECCSQEKIYNKTYGGVAVRFCLKRRFWQDLFAEAFKHYYTVIHRYETNQIRNIATLFGYVLASDALPWEVFECVHMTEEESTSSSRIFMKILFQEMRQELGLETMAKRFKEEYLRDYLENMFPKRDPADTRFSVNYFTAIGLGVLTEDMREHLKNLPPPSPVRERSASRSSQGSSRSRSYSRSSYSSRSRSRSYSRSRSPYSDRSRSPYSDRSRSYSRSPSPRHRGGSCSRSASVDSRPPSPGPRQERRGRLIRGKEMRSRSNSVSSYTGSRSRSPSYDSRAGASAGGARSSRGADRRGGGGRRAGYSRSLTPPSRSRTPRSASGGNSRSRTPSPGGPSRRRSSGGRGGRRYSYSRSPVSRSPSRSPSPGRGRRGPNSRREFSRSPNRARNPRDSRSPSSVSRSPPRRGQRRDAPLSPVRKNDPARTGDKRKTRSPSNDRPDDDGKRRARALDYL